MYDAPPYKMSSVARLTGFSPALLRAWERRYGLLAPQRTEGGHRLYTEEDLQVLSRVREMLGAGRSIGEVASLGRKALLTLRPAGGRVPEVDAEEPEPWVGQAVQAALDLDAHQLDAALDGAFAVLTPDAAIATVVEPVLTRLGDLWHAGRCSAASEHLASASVVRRLLGLLRTARAAHPKAPRVLCAAFPDEPHQLGALVLAYYLSRRGAAVTYLGAALPFEDLRAAIRTRGPSEVFLSVTREALLLTHQPALERLAGELETTQLTVGGQGVGRDHPELRASGIRLIRPAPYAALLTDGLEGLAWGG